MKKVINKKMIPFDIRRSLFLFRGISPPELSNDFPIDMVIDGVKYKSVNKYVYDGLLTDEVLKIPIRNFSGIEYGSDTKSNFDYIKKVYDKTHPRAKTSS